MKDYRPSIFTNMISLLKPPQSGSHWPLTLQLPPLDLEVLSQPVSPPAEAQQKAVNPGTYRSKMKNTACPHRSRKHYAKNMCNNCYHRFGRDKYAVNCPHHDRKLYARGMCQICYLYNYHLTRAAKTPA
mmetsp:Transcript_20870/g.38726  ORF Transcript_20870/g.38726 Transcript_20870/m.38726 type:complete len:129 (-) Transcript_20870:100-486(-)